MCITPNFIWVERGASYEQVQAACRKCWQCRSNKVSDYVGRALCEASTSDWVLTLTLTYAPRDDLADKVLTPRHFQQFIRSLRMRGHSIRYLVSGEYGELKGRAHFHCVLFGLGNKPTISDIDGLARPIPNKKNFHHDAWPHGHLFADWDADEKALRYVCKYILKYDDQSSWFSISKKPPLGAAFFSQKAKEAIFHRVLPSSFEYLPPNGQRGRSYFMTGATRRDYLLEISRGLMLSHPEQLSMVSEWVGLALEKAWKADHIKNAPETSFQQIVDDMRESQAHAQTVFNYEWQKRFDALHKIVS